MSVTGEKEGVSNVDNLKKERTNLRRIFTNACNKFDELQADPDIETETMTLFGLIITICIVSCVTADDNNDNVWRQVLCNNSKNLGFYDDLDKCFELEPERAREVTHDCLLKAHPETRGRSKDFTIAACSDESLFDKVDECFKENEEFKEEMQVGEDAITCYENVFQKYQLTELNNYFRNIESTEKK